MIFTQQMDIVQEIPAVLIHELREAVAEEEQRTEDMGGGVGAGILSESTCMSYRFEKKSNTKTGKIVDMRSDELSSCSSTALRA